MKSENYGAIEKARWLVDIKAVEYDMFTEGAGEMAQPQRALAVLAEDWVGFPASRLNGSQPLQFQGIQHSLLDSVRTVKMRNTRRHTHIHIN